jgi:type VI secretion system protein ImpH
MMDAGPGPVPATETDAVAETIARLGHAPAFATALRALEQAVARSGRTIRPIGTTGTPSEEAVLFRATPSMGFAPADIAAIREGEGDWPVEMDVAFLGLYGPSSPMPAAWTERIVMGMPGADNLRDVLDLFDHPLIALSWRITRSGRVDWLWDREGRDPPSVSALALAGIVPGSPDGLDRMRLLPLAGLLAQHSRGAATVAAIVGRYFGLPAHIEEWVPSRATIPPEQQFRLGSDGAAMGDTSLGETVPDVSGVVRLVLGPLPLSSFVAFLPGGAQRQALQSLLRLAAREPVRIDIELLLAAHGCAGMTLGSTRLGWTSWAAGPGEHGCTPAGSV